MSTAETMTTAATDSGNVAGSLTTSSNNNNVLKIIFIIHSNSKYGNRHGSSESKPIP